VFCNFVGATNVHVAMNEAVVWGCSSLVPLTAPCGNGDAAPPWPGLICQNGIRPFGVPRYFTLSDRGINGTLPSTLGQLSLYGLDLSVNSLGGSIPTALGQITTLTALTLNQNNFVGPIPSQLGNIPGLQSLILFNNSLTGSVPSSLCGLSSLTYIDILNNKGISCYAGCLSTVAVTNFGRIGACTSGMIL